MDGRATKLVGYSPWRGAPPTALNEIYSRAAIAIPLPRSEALLGIAQVVLQSPPRTLFSSHRRSNMTKLSSNFDDEWFLNYEISDESLETAEGKEIAANFTLGSCTGLSECPA